MATTRERWRNRLPHWEVADQPHFVTIHCAHSLPQDVRAKIAEIKTSLDTIAPMSEKFGVLQRQYFLTYEKYFDHATGFAPFLQGEVCQIVLTAWLNFERQEGWRVAHHVIMPNHVHFLMNPVKPTATALRICLPKFKGRIARLANQVLARRALFWQPDWFDRWMRNEAETMRVVDYIQNNPVKAGLVQHWQDYRWVK